MNDQLTPMPVCPECGRYPSLDDMTKMARLERLMGSTAFGELQIKDLRDYLHNHERYAKEQ